MSIERSRSSDTPREVDKARDRPHDQVREKPKEAEVDRFRGLMQSRGDGRLAEQKFDENGRPLRSAAEMVNGENSAEAESSQAVATSDAVKRRSDTDSDADTGAGAGDGMKPSELAALYQAQLLAREAPAAMPAAAAPAAPNPQALADMLEKHVRQLAVSTGGTRSEDGQVLLRLSDSTLPGTDLLLSRTETGWRLRADVRSRGSFDAIQEAAPDLAKRFAARDLGTLEIDPHFNG